MRRGAVAAILGAARPTSADLADDSKAQAERIRSVAVNRIGDVAGQLPADLLREVDRALRLHLDR